MAKILWVWELGGGLGHTLPLKALLTELSARGHEHALALRDLRGVGRIFAPGAATLLQAPIQQGAALQPIDPPWTYAHILANLDFTNAEELCVRMSAWRGLFESVEPDLIVLDHSPTALLALRGTHWRRIQMGHGFFTPPDAHPLPNFRSWLNADPEILRRQECGVLEGMNGALKKLGAAPLERVSQLFAELETNLLCTLPELDHYPQRTGGRYWGHWAVGGAAPEWPAVPGARVFAYVKRTATSTHLLRVLAQSGQPALVFMEELTEEEKALANERLMFAGKHLDFSRVAAECQAAVLNATHYSSLDFLLAGVPLLQVPLQLEQLLTAQATERLGAGVTVFPDRPDEFLPGLQRVLSDPDLRTNAQRFARRYEALRPELQRERLIAWLDAKAAGRTPPGDPVLPPRMPAAEGPIAGSAPPLERPVFIVSAPRAGESVLFEMLMRSEAFATLGHAGAARLESIPELHPAYRNYASNALGAEDAAPALCARLKAELAWNLRDGTGRLGASKRMLECTPRHALRIPFLRAVFPDAQFVYVYREPLECVASCIEAWESGLFVSYPELPGWDGPPWSLLLPPEWRALRGASTAERAAAQWSAAQQAILKSLEELPAESWCAVRYTDLVAHPRAQLERICGFLGAAFPRGTEGAELPDLRALTPAEGERRADEARAVLARLEPVAAQVNDWLAQYAATADERALNTQRGVALQAQAAKKKGPPQAGPIESQATTTFAELLKQCGASVLVTTYQANKLFIARELKGKLNTHFRDFYAPMGLAVANGRLAVGTRQQVLEFQNQPEVSLKLDPPGVLDACFLPRRMHQTGDIAIHEIAWAGRELWLVNTRFSCLCTLDAEHSFVPRWRPPFISAYAPEDRCHLNGLALVEGVPRYVTALGETDAPHGWREKKASGGILMDVASGGVLLRGLSMPHSPRWYDGKIWVLESGEGSLFRFDPQSGERVEICRLPGFTRGLDFLGPFAFIGLSQVRESAHFSGLAITRQYRPEERACGVWVVDVRNGQTVAFLRFSSGVQEIFAIQVLAGSRFPDVLNDGGEEALGNSFLLPESALKG